MEGGKKMKINKNVIICCLTLFLITLTLIGYMEFKSFKKIQKINKCIDRALGYSHKKIPFNKLNDSYFGKQKKFKVSATKSISMTKDEYLKYYVAFCKKIYQ